MDIIKFFETGRQALPISTVEFLFILALSLILSYLVIKIYALTLKTPMPSVDYHNLLKTGLLVSVIAAVVIILVGTNLARAFALLGMLSLIRFRNPSKGPGDLIFVLIPLTIGLCCGVGYYHLSLLFTLVCILTSVMINLFDKPRQLPQKQKKSTNDPPEQNASADQSKNDSPKEALPPDIGE